MVIYNIMIGGAYFAKSSDNDGRTKTSLRCRLLREGVKDNFLFMNVETSPHLSGNTRTVTENRTRNTSTCRMQMTNGSDVRRSSTFSSYM